MHWVQLSLTFSYFWYIQILLLEFLICSILTEFIIFFKFFTNFFNGLAQLVSATSFFYTVSLLQISVKFAIFLF